MRYANVTSTLALIVALGGTSYAAIKLPKDSVGARQIAAGAVRSSEVKDGSVRRADLAPNVLGTPPVMSTPTPVASSTPSTPQIRLLGSPVGSGGGCEAGSECSIGYTVNCGEGWVALGGSTEAPDEFQNMRIVADRPIGMPYEAPVGWYDAIKYTARSDIFGQPTVYAICAKF